MRLLFSIGVILIVFSVGCKVNRTIYKENTSTSLDTLMVNGYILSFSKSDSFPDTDIYGDLAYRNKLTDSIGNSHQRAAKIEDYLSIKFGKIFYETDTNLVLKLKNGKLSTFPKWDEKMDEGYNFEHYFKSIDYYLLHVQFGEGNCWMLVNRKNGYTKYIAGLPYISIDKKKIVTVNSDMEAGFSFNGIELYSIEKDSLKLEFYKETEFGPLDLKWVNKNEFLLKIEKYKMNLKNEFNGFKTEFKRVNIYKMEN